MIDLSRRDFLISVAAVPVALSVPAFVRPADTILQPAMLGPVTGRIFGLKCESRDEDLHRWGICRADGAPLIESVYQFHGVYHPSPDQTIIATQGWPVFIYAEGTARMKVLLENDHELTTIEYEAQHDPQEPVLRTA